MSKLSTNGDDLLDMEPVPQPLPPLEEVLQTLMGLKCVKEYMHQTFSGDSEKLVEVLCRYFIGGVLKNKGIYWYFQHSVFSNKAPLWGIWDGPSEGNIILNVVHKDAEPAKNWQVVSALSDIRSDNFQDINEENLSEAVADYYKKYYLRVLFNGR